MIDPCTPLNAIIGTPQGTMTIDLALRRGWEPVRAPAFAQAQASPTPPSSPPVTQLGGAGSDTLTGGPTQDILWGDRGRDVLIGGDGDDRLSGDWITSSKFDNVGNNQGESDTLTGGAGADTFFVWNQGLDTITDFTPGSGPDADGLVLGIEVWLGQMDNGRQRLTNHVDGINPFASGHLRLSASGADTVLEVDWDGPAGPKPFQPTVLLQGVSPDQLVAGNLNGWSPSGHGPVLTGTPDNDTLNGTRDMDRLDGGAGNDQLYGQAASDTLCGGPGDDTLDGGAGLDLADYSQATGPVRVDLAQGLAWGTDTGLDRLISIEGVTGGAEADTLIGTSGSDTMSGGAGPDHLMGGDGYDVLDGGAGNDTLEGGQSRGTLIGGEGDDLLLCGLYGGLFDGGPGNDTLSDGYGWGWVTYADATHPVTVDLAQGTAWSADTGTDVLIRILRVTGGHAGDIILGNEGSNSLAGGDGNDQLSGGEGNDNLSGADGDDTLDGGAGNDHLDSGAGNNRLLGGDGDDRLLCGLGSNTLDGGEGHDRLDFDYQAPGAVTVDLAQGRYWADWGQGTLHSVEEVRGTSGADTLIGGAGNTTLVGSGGADRLIGGEGNDQLAADFIGEMGSGKGDDTDSDALTGGGGSDDFWLWSARRSQMSADIITDFTAGDGPGRDRLALPISVLLNLPVGANPFDTGHVRLVQAGTDTRVDIDFDGAGGEQPFQTMAILYQVDKNSLVSSNFFGVNPQGGSGPMAGATGSADNLHGSHGNDFIDGLEGADILRGWGGDDTLRGGPGNDTIWGAQGKDLLVGGDGDDYLCSDWITGGKEALLGDNLGESDTLSGGAGADTFILWNQALDTITDFTPGSGSDADHLLLGSEVWSSDWPVTGQLAFTNYVAGANPFASGHLRLSAVGGDTLVEADWDGPDGSGSFQPAILLKGVDPLKLVANNFNGWSPTGHGLVLAGTAGADTLTGSADADQLDGGAGNDRLEGQAASDTLVGGPGDDSLWGGACDDWLIGGPGNDTAVYDSFSVHYAITYTSTGARIQGNGYLVPGTQAYVGAGMPDGTDTLVGVEFAQFADRTVRLVPPDTTAPTLVPPSPSDPSAAVPGTGPLRLQFNEAIVLRSGAFTLLNDQGAVVQREDVAHSDRLAVTGSTLQITLAAPLAFNTRYQWVLTSGAVTDLAGNAYVDPGTLYFQTVPNPDNHAPAGTVTLSGLPVLGQTLEARQTLTDADGLGPLTYQWTADGLAIDGATGATHTLGAADLGRALSVSVRYTDRLNTPEHVRSADSTPVSAFTGTLTGTEGNDRIDAPTQPATVDGSGGIDILRLPLGRASYVLAFSDQVFSLQSSSRNPGTCTFVQVERLQFADQQVALDLQTPQAHASQVAGILGAVYGAEALNDRHLVGVGLRHLDEGMSERDLAQLALDQVGVHNANEVVELLWSHIVQTPLPEAQRSYYLALLQEGMSPAELTIIAAHCNQNLLNIDLVGLRHSGLAFE